MLVNSIAAVERQWRKFAERHGLDPDHVVHTAHGHRTVETVALLLPQADAAAEAKQVEIGEINDLEGVVALPGAKDLLTTLPPERWAIVTSGTRALATVRLKTAGLPVPPKMVPADEVTRGKPDPEPYLKGANLLGLPAGECLVFEDAKSGLRAAKYAGMVAIGIPGTYTADELSEADALVHSLRDVSFHADGDGLTISLQVLP